MVRPLAMPFAMNCTKFMPSGSMSSRNALVNHPAGRSRLARISSITPARPKISRFSTAGTVVMCQVIAGTSDVLKSRSSGMTKVSHKSEGICRRETSPTRPTPL